jgi:hypothetical protein
MSSSLCWVLLAKFLQGYLCQTALGALNPATGDKDEILPGKEDTSLDTLDKPLGPHNFHMLELADLGWCEGTSDNMSAIRSDHSREVNIRCRLHYAHKGLLINIGTVDPSMLDDHPAQFLNRRLCPTVDLTYLST